MESAANSFQFGKLTSISVVENFHEYVSTQIHNKFNRFRVFIMI